MPFGRGDLRCEPWKMHQDLIENGQSLQRGLIRCILPTSTGFAGGLRLEKFLGIDPPADVIVQEKQINCRHG